MNVLRLMRKAARATPHEWAVRIGQSVAAARLRYTSSIGRRPYDGNAHRQSLSIGTVQELQDWWAQQPNPVWLPAEAASAGTFEARLPNAWIRRAEAIRSGRLTFFSHPSIPFDHPHRWRRDLVLEREAPQSFYGSIPYLDAATVGDSKHTWEPNRWGWVYPLGAAYRITRDEAYFETFRRMAEDWCHQNPYPLGINYCSALEQAFRAYAARWALELFREPLAKPGNDALLDALFELVWTACRHVENNLSWYFAPNTHLLGEAFLLFVIGTSLPSFRESPRWRQLGRSILVRESHRQFHADGMHRELSTCYHLYASDFYLHGVWVAHRAGNDEAELDQAARRAVCRLRELTPTTGVLPQLNDCDGGRLTWFADKTLDARPTLLLAQQRWPGDWNFPPAWSCAGDHCWMRFATEAPASRRGNIGMPRVGQSRDLNSHDLDSGIATFHSDSGDYILFRAGAFGYHECPHSHDNPLEVLLSLGGEPLVVDSGTGSYTQGRSLRNQFRFAGGKNTPLVSDCGPSEPEGDFSWRRVTPARLTILDGNGDRWAVAGEHDGYSERFGFPIRIQRQVHVLAEGLVAIIDRWTADREIPVTVPWTLSPGLEPAHGGWRSPGGKVFQILFDSEVAQADRVAAEAPRLSRGPYSRDYGWHELTHVVTYAPPPSRCGSCLSLFVASDAPARVEDRHTYSVAGTHGRCLLSWEPNGAHPFRFRPVGATANT